MKSFELKKLRSQKRNVMKSLVEKVEKENREFSPEEKAEFDALKADVTSLDNRVAALEEVEGDEPSEESSNRKSAPSELEVRQAPAVHTKKQSYRLTRAIGQMIEYGHVRDGVEAEMNKEIARRNGKPAQGFYFPTDPEFRALTTTAGTGAIPTILDKDYIEVLRNKSVVMNLGAKVLNNMQGYFAIPKFSAASNAYWVTEGNAPPASNQTIGQVAFAPKTVGAYTDITRKFFLLNGNDSVESFVRDDLTKVVAIEIDRAAIAGSGVGAEPLGILNNSACPTVGGGTNGSSPNWNEIVKLETTVAAANVPIDGNTSYYLGNAQARAYLKTTNKILTGTANTAAKALMDDEGNVNGYKFAFTQNVPNNLSKGSGTNLSALVFGDFSQLVFAMWGSGADILVDPYSNSTSGTVRIVVLQDVDIKPRYPEAFAKISDIITG